MSDALTRLLEDLRAGRPSYGTAAGQPWAAVVDRPEPLTLVVLLEGSGEVRLADGPPGRLTSGDLAIVTAGGPLVVTATDSGADRRPAVVTATYSARGSICDRVLGALPPLVVVESEVPVEMVQQEIAGGRAGREAVLDRLVGLLLVTGLRTWFESGGEGTPMWVAGQTDDIVGPALKVMHGQPAAPWTVEALARVAGVSRSSFARRFTQIMGEPPMSYLTCWRLCLASDLLAVGDLTVDSVARQVGYANGYSLSAAFHRALGVRPSEHRSQ